MLWGREPQERGKIIQLLFNDSSYNQCHNVMRLKIEILQRKNGVMAVFAEVFAVRLWIERFLFLLQIGFKFYFQNHHMIGAFFDIIYKLNLVQNGYCQNSV